MSIETKTQDGVKIVKLAGKLGMGPSLDQFNATMSELLGQSQNRIVLDLEDMPTIDSSGVGMMIRYLTSAKQSGGAIKLFKPSKFTLETLKMVGLVNLFPTFEDMSAAVSSFR